MSVRDEIPDANPIAAGTTAFEAGIGFQAAQREALGKLKGAADADTLCAAIERAGAFARDHTQPVVMVIFNHTEDAIGFAAAVERVLDKVHGVDTKLDSMYVTNLLGEGGVPTDSAYQPAPEALQQQFTKGAGANAHLLGGDMVEVPIVRASESQSRDYERGFAEGYAKARPLDPGTIHIQPLHPAEHVGNIDGDD